MHTAYANGLNTVFYLLSFYYKFLAFYYSTILFLENYPNYYFCLFFEDKIIPFPFGFFDLSYFYIFYKLVI